MEGTDKGAPVKDKRIKRNSKECFDDNSSEKLTIRHKLFKKYKKSRSDVDKEILKTARYNVQNLIAKREKEPFENKVTACTSKAKG